MEKLHGRNTVYLAMVEAFWGLGMNVVSVGTVIPVFLQRLGASNAVIALLPSLSALGAGLPMLASSYLTHRSRGIKGWVLGLHLLAPLPHAAIAAGLLLGTGSPVVVVLVCWGAYYGFLGLLWPMWLDYMARILDPSKRGRAFGVIFLVQTLSGVAGVSLAAWLLKHGTGNFTYAILFGIAWAAAVGGSLFFLGTREEIGEAAPQPFSIRQHLGHLLAMLRADRWLRTYAIVRCVVRGSYPLIINFYAAYAVAHRGATVSEAAMYGAVALSCQALSGLAFGILGDRTGHKLPVVIGQGALVLAAMIALLPLPGPGFFAVAALTGVYLATEFTSQNNWLMDLSRAGDRQPVLSLVGFLMTPTAVLAPLLGGLLMDRAGFPAVAGAVGAILLLVMAGEWAFLPARR